MGSYADSDCKLIIVRGAGDLATGTIIRLHNAGYKVIALEIERPTVIRRTVAFAEAVYEGSVAVEDTVAERASPETASEVIGRGHVPVVVDPELAVLSSFRPAVLVDAIIACCCGDEAGTLSRTRDLFRQCYRQYRYSWNDSRLCC